MPNPNLLHPKPACQIQLPASTSREPRPSQPWPPPMLSAFGSSKWEGLGFRAANFRPTFDCTQAPISASQPTIADCTVVPSFALQNHYMYVECREAMSPRSMPRTELQSPSSRQQPIHPGVRSCWDFGDKSIVPAMLCGTCLGIRGLGAWGLEFTRSSRSCSSEFFPPPPLGSPNVWASIGKSNIIE